MLPQLPITCFEVWRMNEDFVFESSLKNVKQSDKNTFSALKKNKVPSILLLAIPYKSVNQTMGKFTVESF